MVEKSYYDVNEGVWVTNGHAAPAPQPAANWHSREPRHVHSMKWVDADGIEHLHVLRADDLDEVLKQMQTVKACIKAARAKAAEAAKEAAAEAAKEAAAEAPPEAPAAPAGAAEEPPPGWCPVHNLQMHWNDPKPGDTRPGWWSHRQVDGSFCRGKAKRS